MKLVLSKSSKGISDKFLLDVIANHRWVDQLNATDVECFFTADEQEVFARYLHFVPSNKFVIGTPDVERFGPVRANVLVNRAMAEQGTHLIAFWNGFSTRTGNMIKEAISAGLAVNVFIPSNSDMQNVVTFKKSE